MVKAVPPPPAPPPPAPPRNIQECIPLCVVRCKNHSRKNICLRACLTCCGRCKCVPPGQYGNKEKCGKCYAGMTTRGGKLKCP
ncbi:Gibberellin-regulated family protein [Perilla frutescens var. hirtella]|nr:Gibberellin-regulated family protein [Perilla frutescens var. hirtella]